VVIRRLGVVAALVLVLSSPAAAGLADRIGATFALMAQELVSAFRPIEGLVVQVDRSEIVLDVNQGNGAQIGQEYTIFRKGEAFAHPITGKLLGHFEAVLGWAQIKRVYEEFSVASFTPAPDKPEPRPEDGARITRGRIRVAVTPVLDLTFSDADERRVPFLIATTLERSKRFQVVDPLAVGDMFASGAVRVEDVLSRPERAIRAARNLDVAGWLVPTLIERRGVSYLDVTFVSAVTGAALFSRRQVVLPTSASEEQRFPWEPRAED